MALNPGTTAAAKPLPALERLWALLDRWSWLLLLLIAPFCLFPSPARSLAWLGVPVLLFAQAKAQRAPSRRTPLDWPILIIALMTLVSLYATYDIAVSAPRVGGVVLGIGGYYTAVRFGQSPKGWWLGLALFGAAGLGLAGVALFATRWIPKWAVLTAITSRLPQLLLGLPGIDQGLHPNEVAGALLWVIPMLAVLGIDGVLRAKAWQASLGKWRAVILAVLFLVLAMFATAVFVLTQSRSGYIAFVLAGLALVLLALPRRLSGIFLAVIAIGGIVAGALAWQTDLSAKLFAPEVVSDNPALAVDTLQGRLEIWSRAIYASEDFFFTGIGMNTFYRTVTEFYPLSTLGTAESVTHAHNEFLQAALDLGMPGLIAFVGFYAGAFWMVVKIGMGGAGWKALALGLGGGLLAHCLYGFTDGVDFGLKYGILFWLLLGLIVGLYLQTVSGRLASGAPIG